MLRKEEVHLLALAMRIAIARLLLLICLLAYLLLASLLGWMEEKML